MFEWGIFALIGVFTGLFAGLLGLGGGLVVVPALVVVFSMQGQPESQLIHVAIGTSLMTIIITSLSSMYAHHKNKNINWQVVVRFSPGLILGGFFGAFFATLLTSDLLQKCFSVYVFLVVIQMWLPISSTVDERLLKQAILFSVGTVVGSLSALVGIGGGSFVVPYLVMAKQSMKRAIGTSAACGFPISVAAVIGFLIFGQDRYPVTNAWQTGVIHWQAFFGIISTSIFFSLIGARLAKRLPVNILKQIFSFILIVIGLYLLELK